MKVLIVYPRMDLYGGAEHLVVRLANHLARKKIGHALLTTNLSPEIEKDLTGTKIINYRCRRYVGRLKPLNLILQVKILNKGIWANYRGFDIVNVHNYPAEIAIFPICRPVVWMCNEPPDVHVRFQDEKKSSLRWLVIKAILTCDKMIVRHRINQTVVADTYNKTRFKKKYGRDARVINYGIDYPFFHEKDTDVRPGRKRFTVLHVGMLTPEKNQLESLKVLNHLKDKIPEIELVLVGFGEMEYLTRLHDYINKNKLNPYVEITGHVSRERIRKLYYDAQVLIHPIRPQGGWLSPFEALCTGLPIVVSPAMTASDIIKSNRLGIVTDDYASALLDIYRNPSKYSAQAKRRADWVRDNLSWNKFCDNMIEVFKSAITR